MQFARPCTTRRAAAARGSRISSTKCARRIRRTGACPCRRSAIRAARLVIVGLAPGMHGANATGRPFTGDYAGILLYETLHAYGYASSPVSRTADDPLTLVDCRITNAVKCLPPENKPTARRSAHVQRLPRRRPRDAAGRRRDARARPHRARRGAARARAAPLRLSRSRTARGTRLPAARRCSTAIIAAATTPTPAG